MSGQITLRMAVRVAFKRQATMSPKMTGEEAGAVMALVEAVISSIRTLNCSLMRQLQGSRQDA